MEEAKMKKNLRNLVLCIVVLFTMAGCVSSAIALATQVSEEELTLRWEQTTIGMSVEAFQVVWPEAKYSGYDQAGDDVYFFQNPKVIGMPDIEYFTFSDKKLLKYNGFKASE
jgi:hypothetical protein